MEVDYQEGGWLTLKKTVHFVGVMKHEKRFF